MVGLLIRYLIVNLVKVATCIALYTAVHKSGNRILILEWEYADLEWNILHGERNSRLASCDGVHACFG